MVKSTSNSRRRHRLGRQGRHEQRPGGSLELLPTVPRSRRQGGSPQDKALYTCGCGYAFQAPVSTSVGCPHCGRTQAW